MLPFCYDCVSHSNPSVVRVRIRFGSVLVKGNDIMIWKQTLTQFQMSCTSLKWDARVEMHVKIRCPYIFLFSLQDYPSRGQYHLHMNVNWSCIYIVHWHRRNWEDCINQRSALGMEEIRHWDEETEGKRKREADTDVREWAGLADYVQDTISIMSLCCFSSETKTDPIRFKRCGPDYHREI